MDTRDIEIANASQEFASRLDYNVWGYGSTPEIKAIMRMLAASAFEDGIRYADAHPSNKTITDALQKLGYPVTLNGDVTNYEQVMKDIETYIEKRIKQ